MTLWMVAATAFGQVTNGSTGDVFLTIEAAVSAAGAGDTLTLAPGTYTEHVTVDKDLVFLGEDGATWVGSPGETELVMVLGAVVTFEGLVMMAGLYEDQQRMITGDGYHVGAVTVRRSSLLSVSPTWMVESGGIWLTDVTDLVLEELTISSASTSVFLTTDMPTALTATDVVFEVVTGLDQAIWLFGEVSLTCDRCTFGPLDAAAVSPGDGAVNITRSTFCDVEDPYYGALSPSYSSVTVSNSVFVGSPLHWHLFTSYGQWTVTNNLFAGGALATVSDSVVGNNLFVGSPVGLYDTADVGTVDLRYNWFHDNAIDVYSDAIPDPTNLLSAADPELVDLSLDGDCSNDVLWPAPFASPLIDAGDPSILDPDGSPSDIGPYGGPGADPALHQDADGDGIAFLRDCDDADPNRSPGAPETCDHVDNDCDDLVDEEAVDLDTWFEDCDGDGQGAPETAVVQCFAPVGGCAWVSSSADCDDLDSAVFAGAEETCAIGDLDCDGDDELGAVDADLWFPDRDGDGWGDAEAATASCDPVPGSVLTPGDCDEVDPAVHPTAAETCDGADQDCDGAIDDLGSPTPWYADRDEDGAGDPGSATVSDCPPGPDYVDQAGDCDDQDPNVTGDCSDPAPGGDPDDSPAAGGTEGCGCATGGRGEPWVLVLAALSAFSRRVTGRRGAAGADRSCRSPAGGRRTRCGP